MLGHERRIGLYRSISEPWFEASIQTKN